MIEDRIKFFNTLEEVVPNMSELSRTNQKLFAIARRQGLGASDASVYLGVNLFTTVDELIAQKRSTTITEEEIAIGNLPNVRKGSDLEPLILSKFAKQMDIEVFKPSPMYKIIEHPQLTINFDGVANMGELMIPIEAKWVSSYAQKYWDLSKAINSLTEGTEYTAGGAGIIEHIVAQAEMYGIPPYYYTQIQQQMLGLNAPFGYFAVIFDKLWEFKAFKIFKDEFTQRNLISESAKLWNIIKRAS